MFDLAIYYRMVGGFIGTGSTTLGRLRWAFTMGCYMAFVSVVHHQQALVTGFVFVACLLGAFLGRLIPHARFQATASLGNSLGMTVVNGLRMLLIVAPYCVTDLAHFDGFALWRFLLVVFCVVSGIGYYVGNRWLNGKDCGIYFRNTHAQWRIADNTGIGVMIDPTIILDQCAVGGSEWGELITGYGYELMFLTALVMS